VQETTLIKKMREHGEEVCRRFVRGLPENLRQTSTNGRGVLTIASDGKRYVEHAVNLGRSIRLHSPTIPACVVTDSTDRRLSQVFDSVVRLNREYGNGFRQKLSVSFYTPFQETLYIDSDCLVMRSLESLFRVFDDRAFGIVGGEISSGEWYGDVATICRRLGVDSLPKFNSGVFYFRHGPEAERFFERARSFYDRLPSLGVIATHSGKLGDEPALSAAMATDGMKALPLSDPNVEQCSALHHGEFRKLELNVLAGVCRFHFEERIVEPAIGHFVAGLWRWAEYRRECMRLAMQKNGQISPGINALLGGFWEGWRWVQLGKRSARKLVSTITGKPS
jgi:hypothetical protein